MAFVYTLARGINFRENNIYRTEVQEIEPTFVLKINQMNSCHYDPHSRLINAQAISLHIRCVYHASS